MTSRAPFKFRLWNRKDKEYLDSYSLALTMGVFLAHSHRGCDSDIATIELPVDEKFALQQFTGLTDSTGKDIYEGDIVQLHKGQPYQAKYEVYWRKCGFSLIDAKRDGDKYGVFMKSLENLCPADNPTIIGNIFETPDLCSTN